MKEQPSHTKRVRTKQFSLLMGTIGSEELSVGITHPFRSHRARRKNTTIQPTIVQSKQSTGWGHSDQDYTPLGILNSGTYV